MAFSTIEMVTHDFNYTTYEVNCSELREVLISSASPNYWLVAILAIYFVVGFFGNGVLVVLFMKEKDLRNINNALITNLAVSDFLYLGVIAPIFFGQFYRYRPFGKKFCIISTVTNYTSQAVSSVSLTAVSYFRYCAVVRPLQSRMKSHRKSIITFCLLSWLIGAVFSFFPAMYCEEHPRRDCFVVGRYRINFFYEHVKFFKYFWVRFIVFYLLPLFIIIYFYGRVAYTLCTSSISLETNESIQYNNQATSRSRNKVSIVSIIITVTFFVSWMPTYIYWFNGLDDAVFTSELSTARTLTRFIPAAVDPIILFVTSTNYRKGFLNLRFCRGVKVTNARRVARN
ncbi:Neuropeptide CCHamide-1 receptor [Holothuria leucospilota]|uniref:Neuropeptide CCHamide-1 receptor n=1 Tax=Holothuria leucospilota TaxID=206669 RepID=A0A9Q1CG92_HOLLE|nr:Neuropeptide CCHamide-1 receptor [Holothuria leucospilota]